MGRVGVRTVGQRGEGQGKHTRAKGMGRCTVASVVLVQATERKLGCYNSIKACREHSHTCSCYPRRKFLSTPKQMHCRCPPEIVPAAGAIVVFLALISPTAAAAAGLKRHVVWK